MARKPAEQKLDSLYNMIERHPGRKPGFLARLLGWPRSGVTRSLPALERHGWLLSEDPKGGLWPFAKKQE